MLNCLGNFGQSLYGALWALRGFWTNAGMYLYCCVEFLNLVWHFHQLAKTKSVLSSLTRVFSDLIAFPDCWFSLHFANQKADPSLALHNWQTGRTHTHISLSAYCLSITFLARVEINHIKTKKIKRMGKRLLDKCGTKSACERDSN